LKDSERGVMMMMMMIDVTSGKEEGRMRCRAELSFISGCALLKSSWSGACPYLARFIGSPDWG
jgi:hypothetical protein